MLKNIFRWLTAVISFLIFLIAPNMANAVTQNNNIPPVRADRPSNLERVDLNLISSPLLVERSGKEILDHLACSCAACLKTSSKIR